VPQAVLAASRDLNTVLAGIDAMTKRIDRGIPRDGESADQALILLKEAEPRLTTMLQIMRREHGTPD
jgi:hypothetical protein